MKNKDQIVRIASILEDIEYLIGRDMSDHNQVMALILMDYCNETILKAIHYHLLNYEEDKIADCWKHIDKELQSNKPLSRLSELPYKQEILNIIHRKRNFIQHSGESPKAEEVARYFAYTKLFIEVVSKEILNEDFSSISSASIINNLSFRLLIEKAIEYKDTDPMLAGVLVSCALSHARSGVGDAWRRIDAHLGWNMLDSFDKNGALRGKLKEVFSDIGTRIETNTKTIESLIQDGCNPPKDVLKRLPLGDLSMAQTLSSEDMGGEVTSDDIRQAIGFAIRYISKLEKLELLPKLNLDLEKGIIIEFPDHARKL